MAFNINVKNVARGVLLVVIGLVISWTVLGDTASDVGSAAGNLSAAVNSTGGCENTGSAGCPASVYPLTSFFSRGGVLLLVMMAGMVLVFLNILLPKAK